MVQSGADGDRRDAEVPGDSKGLGLGDCQVIGPTSPADIPWGRSL